MATKWKKQSQTSLYSSESEHSTTESIPCFVLVDFDFIHASNDQSVRPHSILTFSHRSCGPMGTLLESKEALKPRGLEVNLTVEEIDALIDNRVDPLARLAFACCPPGEAPTNDQIDTLFAGRTAPNQGTYSSIKRLISEAQTLLLAELQNKVHRTEDQVKTKMAPAERDNRIKDQRTKLEGLRLREEEECSHSSYDLVLNMLEKDCQIYLGPEKFPTRRQELMQKKPGREISIDQSALIVKDRQQELLCRTTTELETVNAFRRRALAFDLVKCCGFHPMNTYHSELFEHIHQAPPPGYSAVSLAQILRTDRAAWVMIAEKISSLKRDPQGALPLETEILAHPTVSFHLLPLPAKTTGAPKQDKTKRDRSRTPPKAPSAKASPAPSKGHGKGKGRKGSNKKGRGPNAPKGLINKSLQTDNGERLCWAFNLERGCADAPAGGKCARGLHLCTEPGCQKPHSMQNHK